MLANGPKSRPMFLAAATLAVTVSVWVSGLTGSVILHPDLRVAEQSVDRSAFLASSDLQQQRAEAQAYWKRYKDIRTDSYYGENGTLGMAGARSHYDQHGRYEGRVYGPLPQVRDLVEEQALAEAYWQHYPDVAKSAVWGRTGSLGMLGPRDHYRYVGKYQGRRWGPETDTRSAEPRSR